VSGTLALVGGAEFTDACDDVDRALLAAGSLDILVLPTAAAFEHPDRAVATAAAHFQRLGAKVTSLPVLARGDAAAEAHVEAARQSRFTYLAGGSPMHLRSVLKDTPLWQALLDALDAGGVLAGSSAGAMVLTDPMVDPRGGAFTLGLGLLRRVAVVPHVEQWSHDLLHRTLQLAQGFSLVTLESGAAVVRDPDGKWRSFGATGVYIDGQPAALTDLPSA
jgi:cyanophycinase